MAGFKTKNFDEPDYYQPVIFYNQPINVKFHKEQITYPFYSSNIFLSDGDAVKFLPDFIRKLIKDGNLPKDVVKEDNTIDETKVKTAIVPLLVTEMEINND